MSFDFGSAIGGIAGGIASAKAADRAVKRQIAWERERAQNAHQWEVNDLKAAGLNPILSAGGQGAVTGGISAPVPDTSGYQTAGESIQNTITNAMRAKEVQAEVAKAASESANLDADTQNKATQNGLIKAEIELTKGKVGLIPWQTAKERAEAQLKGIEAAALPARIRAELFRNYTTGIGTILGAGGLTAGAISKMGKKLNKVKGKSVGLNNYDRYRWTMPAEGEKWQSMPIVE